MNPIRTTILLCRRPILMLSSHLHLSLASGHLPSGFPTKMLYAFLIPPIHCQVPAHLIPLHLITLIIFSEAYKLQSSSLCSLLQPPATSSLLGPNILLRMLFSNTLNPCSSLSERDQVTHTKQGVKLWFLYILVFVILERRRGEKRQTN
jgi:hypothetical protein